METNQMHPADKENAALAFLHKAASVYRPLAGYEDTVLEICFADLRKTYQLVLGIRSCTVLTEGFRPFAARAEATYPVFEDMLKGRKSPAMALIKGQVKTKGDLKILKKLEEFFPGLEAD